MKKAFVFGIAGKMGKMLCDSAAENGYEIVGGFDNCECSGYKTFDNVSAVDVRFDVIIDFSVPCLLRHIIALADKTSVPVVIATTGHNDSELKNIDSLAEKIPVMRSGNYSMGVAALKAAAQTVRSVLGDRYDIEIVEKHHNQKTDSPSGTALMLADALSQRDRQIFGRQGKRSRGELGIVSVRGGGVVGEHEIGFYGENEIVSLSHSARSRKLFADGAFKAADFLISSKPGLYDMDDLVEYMMNR